VVERQGDNNAGGVAERVTIAEASNLLGCHPNTVRNRVMAGMYSAEKVLTERGPTWMIDRDSLTTNAPTAARQRAVNDVPVSQQEAIQDLARAIVREAGIVQDPEAQARLEGNKLAAEAAKSLVLVASGLLVGMAAVVGVMPGASVFSPLLYLSFGSVVYSIAGGIVWMRGIAEATISDEGNALGPSSLMTVLSFMFGLVSFVFYVLWNSPFAPQGFLSPNAKGEQAVYYFGFVVVAGLAGLVAYFVGRRRKRRRSQESESPPSQSA
jgi:hypothetical protein